MPRTKMPAKKQTKRRRTEEEGIKPTFMNEQAESFYQSSIVFKKCIPERGIDLEYSNIYRQIQARRWGTFVTKPEAAVVPVVREFYANAKEQYMQDPKALRSLVRGKIVQFDSTTINDFYELEDIDRDDYTEWLEGEIDGDEVLQLLAREGGHWEMFNENIRRLHRSQMTTETKAWHYFICGKLIPSNHHSDATRDRAFLNYAIQKGLSINVGNVIEQSIISHLQGRLTGGLGHPSLIYQLCILAGVSTSSTEEVIHPILTITHKMLDAFQSTTAAAPEVGEGAPPRDEAGPSSRPRVSRRRARAAEQTPPGLAGAIVDRLENLERELAAVRRELRDQRQDLEDLQDRSKETKREQRAIKVRQDQAVKEQRQQFDYVKESLQILAALSTTAQPGTSSLLPSPPRFSVYPPPTPPDSLEEEEEDDEEDEEEE